MWLQRTLGSHPQLGRLVAVLLALPFVLRTVQAARQVYCASTAVQQEVRRRMRGHPGAGTRVRQSLRPQSCEVPRLAHQMVCPPLSAVRVLLASGDSHGLRPLTVQNHT
jgi:hypothetical protein